jgi:alpha-galactosidase/6-phospho-beta-glucosidase family protein
MTNQTIKQAVEDFHNKFPARNKDVKPKITEWITQALQAQRDAGARKERERILKLMYTVDVNKIPTIAEEAWANQYDHKAEAFWRGQAQYRQELAEKIINPTH